MAKKFSLTTESGVKGENAIKAAKSADSSYSDARDRFENVFNEALCLSELLDGQRATIDLQLSYSGTIGLASMLQGFYDRGWQALDTLDEAWHGRAGGGNE